MSLTIPQIVDALVDRTNVEAAKAALAEHLAGLEARIAALEPRGKATVTSIKPPPAPIHVEGLNVPAA